MTETPESLPTNVCRVCGNDMIGEFCGNCGARAIRKPGDGPDWWRGSAYAAAPRESVLRPAPASTAFPMSGKRSRRTFGVALLGIVVLILASALLKLQAPLVGLVSVGMPVLFVIYLIECGAFAVRTRVGLLASALLGTAFGVGWAIATEAAIARSGPDALGAPVSETQEIVTSLAIPMTFVALLLAPVLIARLRRPAQRNALDGYGIGALGAFCFAGAGTLTRLASELTSGVMAEHNRSGTELAVAATIQGVAIPLTAAAVGGAVGATLWFTPRSDAVRDRHWYDFTSPATSIGFGVLLYLGLGVLDIASVSFGAQMSVYALVTVLALYGLRAVLHATLLGEAGGDARPDESSSCPECGHPTPALAFCTTCGVARDTPTTSHTLRPLLLTFGAAALVVATAVGIAVWLTPPEPNYVCPPDCGRPPLSQPLARNPRFTSTGGEFSVSYPGEGTAYTATFEPSGVNLDLNAGDGGKLRMFGEPANGRSAREVVEQFVRETYPDASTAYDIPNAQVGYQLGYGVVADVYSSDSIVDDSRMRVLVMAAVKNDYALIASGSGPFHEFTPDFGSGHPSGANFFLSMDMGKYVNSFMWRGDPPR